LTCHLLLLNAIPFLIKDPLSFLGILPALSQIPLVLMMMRWMRMWPEIELGVELEMDSDLLWIFGVRVTILYFY
jgi:hypothetical protein